MPSISSHERLRSDEDDWDVGLELAMGNTDMRKGWTTKRPKRERFSQRLARATTETREGGNVESCRP